MSRHVAVWIDHQQARLFRIQAEKVEEQTVKAPASEHHRHSEGEKEHPSDRHHFYHDVAKALAGTEEILVMGPSVAKVELVKHLHEHDRAVGDKIVGVETVDHPSDGQIVAFAKKYFNRVDHLI
jgi:stalled ribosome rescue protein Dom34